MSCSCRPRAPSMSGLVERPVPNGRSRVKRSTNYLVRTLLNIVHQSSLSRLGSFNKKPLESGERPGLNRQDIGGILGGILGGGGGGGPTVPPEVGGILEGILGGTGGGDTGELQSQLIQAFIQQWLSNGGMQTLLQAAAGSLLEDDQIWTELGSQAAEMLTENENLIEEMGQELSNMEMDL